MISSKKINLIGILLLAAAVVFTVCVMLPKQSLTGNRTGSIEYSENHTVTLSDNDYYSDYSNGVISKISLNGTSATADSKNVSISGGEVTILGGGTYVLKGELSDGSIIVDSSDGAEVRLVLGGVNVTSSDFSPLYVKQAGRVVISLVRGTENYFTDSGSYSEEKTEDNTPSAAVYSKDDLVINGEGTLVVNSSFKDGIKANDTLKITEGNIKVTAADEGINTNDYIALLDAAVEINSGSDAVRCENQDERYGFIALESTMLTVVSEGDGIYSSSSIYANDVTAEITTGGGAEEVNSENGRWGHMGGFGLNNQSTEDAVSKKAIKATNNVLINSGSYTVNSNDDAIHSDGDLTVIGGKFTLSSSDDAIHAEKNVRLAPESMDIAKCREGIEGAYIIIDDGDITVKSTDDAINAVGENSMGGFGGMPMEMRGGEAKTAEEDIYLTVNGGNIYIETSGDGIDSNGSAVINGGNIRVYGPENSGNGTIDVGDGGYVLTVNGGSMLAAGSMGMAEAPYEGSKQYSLAFYLNETYQPGSVIALLDENGNELISGTSGKRLNWVCVSTPDIETGKKYTLTVNGSEVSSAEITDVVTQVGNQGRRAW